MDEQQKLKLYLLKQRKPKEYQWLKKVFNNIKEKPTERVISNMRLACALHDTHSFNMLNSLDILDRWLKLHYTRMLKIE